MNRLFREELSDVIEDIFDHPLSFELKRLEMKNLTRRIIDVSFKIQIKREIKYLRHATPPFLKG